MTAGRCSAGFASCLSCSQRSCAVWRGTAWCCRHICGKTKETSQWNQIGILTLLLLVANFSLPISFMSRVHRVTSAALAITSEAYHMNFMGKVYCIFYKYTYMHTYICTHIWIHTYTLILCILMPVVLRQCTRKQATSRCNRQGLLISINRVNYFVNYCLVTCFSY